MGMQVIINILTSEQGECMTQSPLFTQDWCLYTTQKKFPRCSMVTLTQKISPKLQFSSIFISSIKLCIYMYPASVLPWRPLSYCFDMFKDLCDHDSPWRCLNFPCMNGLRNHSASFEPATETWRVLW